MRKVNKETIENLIEVSRLYWKIGNISIHRDMVIASELVSMELYGTKEKCIILNNFISGICGKQALKDCSNEEIFEILKLVGIEVV